MRINLRVALLLLIGLVAMGGVWSGISSSGTVRDQAADGLALKSASLVIDFGPESQRQPKVITVENLAGAATGWDVLLHAGIKVQGTDQYPTGFVCRLEGWPNKQTESCAGTPAYSKGHWAYFLSSKSIGAGWILSGQGAATHVPECGDVEGWKWIAPNAAVTPPKVKPEMAACPAR